MTNTNQTLFTDTRLNFRINESRNVLWKVKEGFQKGKARIRNLSATGMMIETNGTFVPPKEGCLFSFDTTLGHDNYVPQYGELVWSRRRTGARNRYNCGIRFVEPGDYVEGQLRQRIQRGLLKVTTNKRLSNLFSALLILAITALTGITIWMSKDVYTGMSASTGILLKVSGKQAALTRHYKDHFEQSQQQLTSVTKELNATRALYMESKTQLGVVNQELSDAKQVIAQTEAMLAEARNGTAEVQNVAAQNADQFARSKTELETQIASLQEKNNSLQSEMKTLQEQLSFYEGNAKNIDEGYVLLNIYRERMKTVKEKIKGFNREVLELRQKAQNERDRIKLALGNNGFFMRDGAAVKVDQAKYDAAGTAPAVVRQSEDGLYPKVEINVSNFE